MKFRISIVLLLILVQTCVTAQQDASYLEMVKAENSISLLFDQLYDFEDLRDKDQLYEAIDSMFQSALVKPGSFDYGWSKLDKIGKLRSDDKKVKVFSWLYMKDRDHYLYTCYIQIDKGRGKSQVFRLKPGTASNIKSEDYLQSLEDWHGKIYYQLITSSYKRKTFYTLLGADFNNTISTLKTVEVFAIQRGKPVFRGAQFLDGGTVKNRMVFEYSSEVAMSLRYNPELEQIVFDHLAPLHPLYHGSFQFYGPDGSYDGMKFLEGIWVLEEDVDARND